VRDTSEIQTTRQIRWDWFDKRLTPKIPVAIEQGTTLTNQVGVAQIKRAIKIAQVDVAEVVENGEWIIHMSGWRSSSAANRAISGDTSE
jgi:hypothetical protein